MKRVIEIVQLFLISLKVRGYFLWEEGKVWAHFYPNRRFRARDTGLKRAYRFSNPYTMNKRFLLSRGYRDGDTYGETPLTTLYKIAQTCGITAQDYLIELGCGRGRGAFFLSDFIGCKVRGVDWNPEFIQRAQNLAQNDPTCTADFLCCDILRADLSQATGIYLFGTCLDEDVIHKLTAIFSQLADPVKIITVSFPLSDYSSSFLATKEFSGSFPWGKTSVFLNQKIDSHHKLAHA